MVSAHEQFQELAWKCGLAAPHQRQVIHEAIVATPGHHSTETIYAAVRRRIPSISLAAAYKNLRMFVEHGLLREVSPHASPLLVEGNLEPHHHLVCTRCCKAVQGIEGDFIHFKRLLRQAPRGFDPTQLQLDVFGLCRQCSAKT
jgi:Fur family peroxide stress response transcriptional regulator